MIVGLGVEIMGTGAFGLPTAPPSSTDVQSGDLVPASWGPQPIDPVTHLPMPWPQQTYNIPGSPSGWTYTPAQLAAAGCTSSGYCPNVNDVSAMPPLPPNVLTTPPPPTTPTPQQITGGLNVQGTPALVPATATGSGFTMPTILTEASVGGIPNWMLLAGALAAFMLLKK